MRVKIVTRSTLDWLLGAGQRPFALPSRCVLSFAPLIALAFLSAATPPAETTTDDLIGQANAAFLSGDHNAADRLYAAAEERTLDPGLVAFNRGVVFYQSGEYREAELHFLCVLSDAACPAERAARAWYNRGACLVRRGGSPAVYREAIIHLERCLDSDAADAPLKADARYNLELAKILWNEARKTSNRPDSPNDDPPASDAQTQPPTNPMGNDNQMGDPGDGNNKAGISQRPIAPQNVTPPAGTNSNTAANQNSGSAPNLQPLQDSSTPQPMSPEDTREHLKRTQERLKKDRQNLRNSLYGPERPGLLDW